MIATIHWARYGWHSTAREVFVREFWFGKHSKHKKGDQVLII